jgi:hypothetical protein
MPPEQVRALAAKKNVSASKLLWYEFPDGFPEIFFGTVLKFYEGE